MIQRYVLTGAPGAGKSVLLRALAERGWSVVEEAATDVITDRQAEEGIAPTAARRITYADSLTFQVVHEEVYREHGFTLLDVPPGPPARRADLVESTIARFTAT